MTDPGDHCGDLIEAAAPEPFVGLQVAVTDRQTSMVVDIDFLSRVAESLLNDEGTAEAEISIALVDDAKIHEINQQYLNHDYPTDVISFLLSKEQDSTNAGYRIDGEVIISCETAARSADEYGCPPLEELTLYLVHGLLHLCGYDDRNPADRERMRDRERLHLQKYGIEPNY